MTDTDTATTLEQWYCPSGSGTPAEPKIGPGDPSSDIAHDPDPWNVLRFRSGFLTIDTADAHYPEWRKWLEKSAGALPGLRVITPAEKAALEHIPTDAEWADLSARRAAAVARRG